jgi:hypothetical protein
LVSVTISSTRNAGTVIGSVECTKHIPSELKVTHLGGVHLTFVQFFYCCFGSFVIRPGCGIHHNLSRLVILDNANLLVVILIMVVYRFCF